MSTHPLKRPIYATIATLSTAATATALYHYRPSPSPVSRQEHETTEKGEEEQKKKKKTMLPSYEATFSVPLSCESCVGEIRGLLEGLPGIQSTSFSLASQLVTTTGTAPPSSIISSIQSTGRPAILRGSGSPNSAAVVILSIPPPHPSSTSVRGLIRLIQLTPSLTLLDLSLNSLPPGRYRASLRRGGDISRGAASMGPVFDGTGSGGEWGTVVVTVDERGAGALMGEIGCPVADMVGRGVLVEREREQRDAGSSSGIGSSRQGNEGEQEEDSLVVVGVVARSAGVWENDKVVCACSGKTVWQEREEMRGKGVL